MPSKCTKGHIWPYLTYVQYESWHLVERKLEQLLVTAAICSLVHFLLLQSNHGSSVPPSNQVSEALKEISRLEGCGVRTSSPPDGEDRNSTRPDKSSAPDLSNCRTPPPPLHPSQSRACNTTVSTSHLHRACSPLLAFWSPYVGLFGQIGRREDVVLHTSDEPGRPRNRVRPP